MTCSPREPWSVCIFLSAAAPERGQWMWTLGYGYHEDRTPTHRAIQPCASKSFSA
jgi:hypothetical protein